MVIRMRHTKSHTANRRSHHALKMVNLGACSHCGIKKLGHTVCGSCGYYKDKKVIDLVKKAEKKISKKKEKMESKLDEKKPKAVKGKSE